MVVTDVPSDARLKLRYPNPTGSVTAVTKPGWEKLSVSAVTRDRGERQLSNQPWHWPVLKPDSCTDMILGIDRVSQKRLEVEDRMTMNIVPESL